jgi:LCP family protein required for cell wall assembly/PAS domain S-box-containing protein
MPNTTEMETHLTALFSEVGASGESQRDVPVSIQSLRESADARRQARRREMVFQSLVDGAIDAISVGNLEGRLVYSNRACYDLFGYDYELQEMEDISLADLWPKEKAYASIKQVFLRAKRGGWSGETRMRCKDGGLFDAYLTAFSVMDGGDRPADIAFIIRDISERKVAEREEVYRSRARQVQLVTEVSQEIASASSLDELYRRVVTLLQEVFGYWHVRLFRYAPDEDALMLVAACGQTGEGIEVERGSAAAKGSVIAAAAAGYPILIPDVRAVPEWASYSDLPGAAGELAVSIKSHGHVLGVLDVLSDTAGAFTREDEILLMELAGQIANAIRSTRLLEEADVLHRFADASEGIGWITLEGGLFIYANPTLCSILGETKPEDTFGKSILSYYPGELRQRVQNEILPAVLREGQWIGELSFVSARGKVVPTMQSIFLVRDDSGKPLYLANVVTDIFEQKQFKSAADKRVRQIACLNDVGKRIEAEPQISDLLEWVAERVPQAMLYPDVCVAAVVFEDASRSEHIICGKVEAIDLPCQIKEDLTVCGEAAGRVCVSYTQEREFSDEDRMLLGDIGRRVSAYIESRRLAERAEAGLEEVMSAHRVYKPEHWTELVSKPASLEEKAQPEMAAPSATGRRARLRKSRFYEILQRLLRRRPVRLLLLLLVPALLAGMLFTTGGGFLAHGWPPTLTPKAVAAARFHSDSTVLTPLSTMPAVDPISTPDPTGTLPVIPSTLPTSLPSLSPTPTSLVTSHIVFSPTPTSQSTDLVIPLPFPAVEPTVTPTLPISPPVQPVPVAADAVNIVVLGSDQRPDWSEWHTDVVQIVSIQRDRGVVSIISIPRDLYVYIPGFWMSRINFADYYGEVYGYEGGGPALVRDTLLYNLGIRVDYYVRTNFDGLIGIVDTVGGIDIPVHCSISDHWPYPDEDGEYPILTLEPGIHHVDGETALWYARTRMTTSVFSRERRQQQVLQALWHKLRDDMTLAQIPSLWEQGRDMVETDLAFEDILDLARVAFVLEDQSVRFYNIGADEVTPWTTPYGGNVFLPQWEAIQPIVAEAMAPQPLGRLRYVYKPVEVWNGTANQDWDLLAADRVYRAGLSAVVGEPDRRDYAQTQLILFTASAKGSGVDYLQQVFNIPDSQVIHQPGGSSEFGMRLILGADYQTCPYP